MRQRLGPRKVEKYKRLTGLAVVGGLVRGNTEHRVDLLLEGGAIVSRWPDGSLGAWDAEKYTWHKPRKVRQLDSEAKPSA